MTLSGAIRGVPLPVPRLIQGTLHLGQLDPGAADRLLDAAFEAGLNAFDTAPVYGQRMVERALGDWLSRRRIRREVTLIDKGCHPLQGVARMNPAELRRDVDGSLERLGTDYIDLYLLHRDDPDVPVDEIVCALNELLGEKRLCAFGASNWSHLRLEQASDYARRRGLVGFAASSPGLSLAEPVRSWPGCLSLHPRDEQAYAWYRANQMPVLAWSPIAGGFLSGRFGRDDQERPLSPAERRTLDFYASEANFSRLDRLTALARAKGLSPAQAALAYVFSQPLDVYAVMGCRDAAEIAECRAVIGVRLTLEELAWLDGTASSA